MEALLNADVDVTDIEDEAGKVTVFAPPVEYAKAKTALSDAFGDIEYDVDEIQFIPQTYTGLGEEDLEMFEKFTDLLNDLDDVQNIFHNVENQ